MSLKLVVYTCTFLTVLAPTMAIGVGSRSHSNMRQTNGHVQVTASVAKGNFAVGEPITLKLVLKNNTDDDLVMTSAGARSDYELVVRNGEGKLAPLTKAGERHQQNRGFRISVGRVILKPGEEREDTISVTELYDLSTPGNYSLFVKREGPPSIWTTG